MIHLTSQVQIHMLMLHSNNCLLHIVNSVCYFAASTVHHTDQLYQQYQGVISQTLNPQLVV